MTQAAKSTIQQLKASLERLNQAQSNPQAIPQIVQEAQAHLQKLESQLRED